MNLFDRIVQIIERMLFLLVSTVFVAYVLIERRLIEKHKSEDGCWHINPEELNKVQKVLCLIRCTVLLWYNNVSNSLVGFDIFDDELKEQLTTDKEYLKILLNV